MKSAFTAIILASLISCIHPDEPRSLSGFWVSTDYYKDKPFQTLIIRDSVIETNRYGIDHYIYPLFKEGDAVVARYPFHGWEVAFTLSRRGDTLFQLKKWSETDSMIVKYVPSDSTKIAGDLLLFDRPLRLHLPEGDIGNTIALPERHLHSSIYIGKLRKGSLADFPLIGKDSIVMQVYDVFIPLQGIEDFLKNEKSKLDESDRDRSAVVLYASEEVTEVFLKDVVEKIHEDEPGKTVYRAKFNWVKKEFLYERI